MKIFKSAVFICLFSLVVVPACIKNTVSVDYVGTHKTPDIILPKPIVKKGEPFTVSTNVQDPNTVIKWAIRPSDSTVLIPYGNEVVINISLAGSYLLTASFYTPTDTVKAYDSTHSTIIVSDSVYSVPPSGLDSVRLNGDELSLTPVYSVNSGFKFILKGNKLYNCYPFLAGYEAGAGAPGTSPINMNFQGAIVVEGTGGCQGVQNPVVLNIPVDPIGIGVHTIAVNYNDTKYEGSVNVTDSNFTFTWIYTSGIIISPKQIKKN